MAIFGRKTARRRLRTAARQSLTMPAFSTPVDCTTWVLDGLWPAELATITPETATLAEYLNSDLQRIARSANDKLQAISGSGLAGRARQAAEARVINVARAFAVLRVESTVRQLHQLHPEALQIRPEQFSLNPVPQVGDPVERSHADPDGHELDEQPYNARHRRPETIVVGQPDQAPAAPYRPASARDASDPVVNEPDEPAGVEVAGHVEAESGEQRLRRMLEFVARQAPGLRWAIGVHGDGRTVLVTDLAHGWVPSGIELPAGVRLLEPGRHDGNVTALLGSTAVSATYVPGDRLGWATESGPTEPSPEPRALPGVDDLGWMLTEATHWRDGLPRMANTLAKAGAAGTGVAEAEIDLLRVHLDTARYQLLAQYPDADATLLLNCMLLAATEGIATGDKVSANYHFAWFRALSTAPPGRWSPRS